MKTKLTFTRLAALRKCPRLHQLRYELGLKAHLLGESLTKLYAVVAELFPLPEETN